MVRVADVVINPKINKFATICFWIVALFIYYLFLILQNLSLYDIISSEKFGINLKGEIDMRKTKIVCTIGPASETKEVLSGLCKAGMNVARLNFSHGTHADHQKRIDMIKEVRKELNLPIAIMLDTKGPEYRIITF